MVGFRRDWLSNIDSMQRETDMEEIPQQVKEELEFILVEHIDEVLKTALRAEASP